MLTISIFAKRLSAARHMRGLTQSELASRTGLQQVAISFFETGRRSPSLGNLKRLADALNVTTDYLMGRSKAPEMSAEAIFRLIRDGQKLTSHDVKVLRRMAANPVRGNSR